MGGERAAPISVLIEAPVWRATFRYGAPIAAALAFHGLFNLADLLIIGRLGREGVVAAVNLASILVTAPLLVFDGVCNAGVAWIARSKGAGREDEAAAFGKALAAAALAASVVTAIGFLPIAEAALRSYDFGAEDAHADAREYLRISVFGSVAMFVLLAATAHLRGLGDARRPVYLLVGANALNLALDVALVFGLWGFPNLGVAGAAWGTVVARGVAAAIACAIVYRRPRASVATAARDLLSRAVRLTREGAPTSLQLVIRAASFLWVLSVAEKAAGAASTSLQVGVNVAQRVEMIPLFAALGYGAAAVAVVGQNLGAGRTARAERAAWWTAAHAAIGVAAMAGLLWRFRAGIYDFVHPGIDAHAVAEADAYWARALPALPIVAVGAVLARAMNGASQVRAPLGIDFVFYLVFLPAASRFASDAAGPAGAWNAMFAAHALATATYAAAFLVGGRKRREKFLIARGGPA